METTYYLNAVDPGGDSGMSLLHVTPDTYRLVDHHTAPYSSHRAPRVGASAVETLRRWYAENPGTHHLVYENFHIRDPSNPGAVDPIALCAIGAIEQMLRDHPDRYDEVQALEAAQGKGGAPDAVLEALGLHFGHEHAQRHVRDSLRHAVTILKSRFHRPVCRQAHQARTLKNPRPGCTS